MVERTGATPKTGMYVNHFFSVRLELINIIYNNFGSLGHVQIVQWYESVMSFRGHVVCRKQSEID